MSIVMGYSGLALSFVVILVLGILIFIRPKVKPWMAILIIPILIWYGLVMLFVPNNILGWPVQGKDNLPERGRVLSVMIKEPSMTDKGMILLWMIGDIDKNNTILESISPNKVFQYSQENIPRAYKLSYSRQLHNKIVEAQRRQGKNGILIMKKDKGVIGKGKKKQGFEDDQIKFKVLNLRDVLKKSNINEE